MSTTSAREVLLEAKDVTAGYTPGVNILNNCSLTLHRGEIVGIIGPNGAGKSTLLKALFGLLSVQSGSITHRGESIVGLHAHELVERGIGYVPQRENVFPSLSILENLEMGIYLKPKQFRERADFVMNMFPRLAERKNQRAGSLSGGERQMLAMGRALMSQPKVLLLDEPSMGLSPIMVDKIFEVVRDVYAQGVTVLLVEQNARRALQIADRGYVMDSGEITMNGIGKDMLDDPKVRAAYLGE